MMKRTFFFDVSSRKFLGLHRTVQLQLLSGQGIYFDYCDIEWFVLEINIDYSVIFEIATKNYISDSFVDYEDYSISSMGFLSTVADTRKINAKGQKGKMSEENS